MYPEVSTVYGSARSLWLLSRGYNGFDVQSDICGAMRTTPDREAINLRRALGSMIFRDLDSYETYVS